MKVVILCGGKGTRLGFETKFIPKPMAKIDKDPIILHIINYYKKFGFNKFILALGYAGVFVAILGGFLVYGSLRFFTEIFREPDSHIGFILFEAMTMGQLLCLPMIIIGGVLVVLSRRNRLA